MAINAEPDDAPDWLVQQRRKTRPLGVVTALIIGSLLAVGLLALGSRALPVHERAAPIAQRDQTVVVVEPQPTPASSGTVTRTPPMPGSPEVASAPATRLADPRPVIGAGRQTVFNDQNFTPRGADNVIRLGEPIREAVPPEASVEKVKVTVITQTPSMKDRACWPFKPGSLERRNCRASVGLNYRD